MKKLAAFLAIAMLLGSSAYAETQSVKVSGSLDAYWFYRDNFDLSGGNDAGSVPAGTAVPGASHAGTTTNRSEADDFFMSITQVQIDAQLTDNVSTVINIINQRDWNAAGFATGTTNPADEFDLFIDLAYVQMKEIFYSPLTLTIGRQDLLFGRGFIIGWNPTDPAGTIQADEFTQSQAFDAVRATLDFNPWTLDFVYSKITEGTNNAEDDRDLYIANINYQFQDYNAVAELYYVGEFDRFALSSAAGTNDNETDTIGGRVQFDPISAMTLGAEYAYQFGDYRAVAGAPERDRDAWALDLFGEYRFDNAWKSTIGIEYVYLSGEEDLSPGSAQDYGSWNGAFRGPVYGWYHDYKEVYWATAQPNDQAAGQNQQHIMISGSIMPLDDLKLGVNYFHFWTTDASHTTITDPTTATLDDHIGDEVDVYVNYAYTEDVAFNFYANWFIPGGLYTAPNDDTATELISEVKVNF